MCFCTGIRFAVWVHSSVDAVVAALLIDLVPALGAILIGALSAMVGFVVFHARVAMEGWSASVFCFCFFMGFGCSIAALMPLKSGSTTLIICYAEEKDFLRRKAPALYEALCQAQLEYDRDSSVASASSSRRGSHQNQQGQQARDVRAAPLMEMQAVQGQSQGRWYQDTFRRRRSLPPCTNYGLHPCFRSFREKSRCQWCQEEKRMVRCMPLKGIGWYRDVYSIQNEVYHQCGSQAEIDSLHEEALRAAADLKQGNTKEGQELLIGLAQDGTIATRMSQHEMVGYGGVVWLICENLGWNGMNNDE